jgi:hypothetical protein
VNCVLAGRTADRPELPAGAEGRVSLGPFTGTRKQCQVLLAFCALNNVYGFPLLLLRCVFFLGMLLRCVCVSVNDISALKLKQVPSSSAYVVSVHSESFFSKKGFYYLKVK